MGGLELGPSPTVLLTPPLATSAVCPTPAVLQRVGIRLPLRPQLIPACSSSVSSVLSPVPDSTSDIVFFGENLPPRFFSCMQSVSVHPGLGPRGLRAGGRWAQRQGSGVQVPAATPRRTSRRWTSSSSWAPPCRCSPSPPSSASRLRGRTGGRLGTGDRADPESSSPFPGHHCLPHACSSTRRRRAR